MFEFTHRTETAREEFWERFFSIVPGLASWTILISLSLLCFIRPLYGAVLIIAFEFFWVIRIFYMTLFLAIAYAVLEIEKKTDWTARCHALEEGRPALNRLEAKMKETLAAGKIGEWFDQRNQRRELRYVLRKRVKVPHYESVFHVVLIAAAKEGREIIEPGLAALTQGQFPASRMLPVLAVEARTGPAQAEMAESLKKKYRGHFFDFLVTSHPDGIPGEERVKGANVTYAAKQVAKFLEKEGIDFANVVLSCFDADTVASPQYFAALTYHFMRHPRRTRASFQPVPVYHNNILEAPAIARVLETGSSFFQLIEATNPEKLVTFSSHSMSFQALVEIGYWPVDMISDDSAIFWKALVHYHGDYRVVPMYVTLSMDVVMADSTLKTVLHIYKQKLRWAWGVENFPIVMRAFLHEKTMPLRSKIRYVIKLLEMHVTWATLGFIVTFIGWLPAIFAGREFSSSVLYYNSPRIAGLIFNMASTTLVVSIILALMLLPKRKEQKIPLGRKILYASEWLLIPLIFTFLSCLPALDAQSRLMRASRLEFWVTEKKRRQASGPMTPGAPV